MYKNTTKDLFLKVFYNFLDCVIEYEGQSSLLSGMWYAYAANQILVGGTNHMTSNQYVKNIWRNDTPLGAAPDIISLLK